MSYPRTIASIVTLAAALLVGASAATALPARGSKVPNAKVEDADGRVLWMKSLKGKPILIVYEDKDSATQNQALKNDLSKLAKGDKYKSIVALAAVADVSSYDFWPVKGFVKDAIREESKKVGTTIYCDWDASFRSAFKLKEGTSSVVLVGRSGEVLFAAEGALSTDARKRLLALLKTEVEGS
ncbi:MAG: YtfJ family protein [Polyangiaceae bacterium]|nr:YtfJ family protein [Polyangiaceae bacterium]